MNNDRNSLSSDQIKYNFKNIKPDRHLATKFWVLIGVILVLIFIYFLTHQPPPPPPPAEPTKDSTKTPVAPASPIPVHVYASSIDDLRSKLGTVSASYLSKGKYTPVNLRLNISNNLISFDLKEVPSSIIKLSLLWGPQSTGCESCQNALLKNPGSSVLLHKEESGFIYEVIAIAR